MPTLLDPLVVGEWRLPNRVVLAPLTRTRASAGRVPNALMAEYYRQRASAGLIISEATSVDPMGVGYPDTPKGARQEKLARDRAEHLKQYLTERHGIDAARIQTRTDMSGAEQEGQAIIVTTSPRP